MLLRLRYAPALQFLLNGLQIVHALGLPPGGQVVPLRAHILDLRQLQRAVLLRLIERTAGNIRVDMDLERPVILADDQTVANAVQIGPQGP